MRANIAHAHDHGANGSAGVLVGDARQLPRPLTRNARDFLERNSLTDVARLGVGVADLIVTSPRGRHLENQLGLAPVRARADEVRPACRPLELFQRRGGGGSAGSCELLCRQLRLEPIEGRTGGEGVGRGKLLVTQREREDHRRTLLFGGIVRDAGADPARERTLRGIVPCYLSRITAAPGRRVPLGEVSGFLRIHNALRTQPSPV
jgi:hypothetical protein